MRFRVIYAKVSPLDWVLISILFVRLLLEAYINYANLRVVSFGFSLLATTNPFSFRVLDSADYSLLDKTVFFLERSQGILLIAIVVLIFLGQKYVAAGISLFSLLTASILPAIVFASFAITSGLYVDPWNKFFELLNESLSLDGGEGLHGKFNLGVSIAAQTYSGIGLLIAIGFLVFYTSWISNKSSTKNLKLSVNEKEDLEMNFCSKCGEPVAGASFCPKCGFAVSANSNVTRQGTASLDLAVPRTSPLAITALVLSFFVSILGLVLGYVARNEIRRSKGTLTGDGLALAAIVIGWIWTGLAVIVGLFWIGAISTSMASNY